MGNLIFKLSVYEATQLCSYIMLCIKGVNTINLSYDQKLWHAGLFTLYKKVAAQMMVYKKEYRISMTDVEALCLHQAHHQWVTTDDQSIHDIIAIINQKYV